MGKDLRNSYGKDYIGTLGVWVPRRDVCIENFGHSLDEKGIQYVRKRGREENPEE